MTFKRATTLGVLGLVLAGGAWAITSRASAQSSVTGMVEYIDPSTRTVYFTDGGIMQLKPGAVVYVDGRAVAIDDLAPGARAEMKADALASPATEVVALVTPPAHPPINVEGTVASVDSQSGLITFTDGRVVRATDGTFVWLSVPLASLQPGMNVAVHQAQPAVSSAGSGGGTSATVVTTPARPPRHAMTTRSGRNGGGERYAAGSALPRFRFDAMVPPDQVHAYFPPQTP